MTNDFLKYILVMILFVAIVITVIFFIIYKQQKSHPMKRNSTGDAIDVNKTLDLKECSQIAGRSISDLPDDMFEIEYELTFIHTNEIIM